MVGEPFPAVVEWFREASTLREQSPELNFSLVLSDYAVEFSGCMVEVAMLHEARMEHHRRLGIAPCTLATSETRIMSSFTKSCQVIPRFTSVMEEIMRRGSSTFRVDVLLAEPWDLEAVLEDCSRWGPDEWESRWVALLSNRLDLPDGGRRGLARAYWVGNARPFSLEYRGFLM